MQTLLVLSVQPSSMVRSHAQSQEITLVFLIKAVMMLLELMSRIDVRCNLISCFA